MSGKILFLQPKHKGIYLLPNMLTTIAMCFGFMSIILSIQGDIVAAAKCIFFALIADGLDGRVARITGTQTEFGKQYDSLSDMVAFGVAPSILIFMASLHQLGSIALVIVFCYTALTAIRLAKFNVKSTGVGDFQGLPCPSAALLIATTVWLFNESMVHVWFCWVNACLILSLGFLMISSISYPSFKQFDFKEQYSKFLVLVMVLVCAILFIYPAHFLWLFFLMYVLYGPVICLYRLIK